LEELGLMGKVQVITTDLFQEIVPLIEDGKVLATMYQRPFTQGKLAFERLLKCLIEGGKPQPLIRLVPHVIFRSNLSLFSSQIAGNDDELETELQQT